MARFPASLVVTSLIEQLSAAKTGYSGVDYLAMILERAAIARGRVAGDSESVAQMDVELRKILARVLEVVAADSGIDLEQLTEVVGEENYYDRVLEVYRFFCCDRLRNARALLFTIISGDRKGIADAFRRSTSKKDQTVQQARKTFVNFDDVLVFVSMPAIVSMVCKGGESSMTMEEVLDAIGDESGVPAGGVVREIAAAVTGGAFSAGFLAPLIVDPNIWVGTYMEMRDRWMASCQKKTEEE